MGHVDLFDHLIYQYRMNYWSRKRKWWWSILMWGLGVKLTNAYVMYKTLNLHEGRNKKDLISHHYFRKRIALCWINPEIYNNDPCSGKKRSLLTTSSDSTRQGRRRKTQSDNAASVSSLSAICNGVTLIKNSRACTVSYT